MLPALLPPNHPDVSYVPFLLISVNVVPMHICFMQTIIFIFVFPLKRVEIIL